MLYESNVCVERSPSEPATSALFECKIHQSSDKLLTCSPMLFCSRVGLETYELQGSSRDKNEGNLSNRNTQRAHNSTEARQAPFGLGHLQPRNWLKKELNKDT